MSIQATTEPALAGRAAVVDIGSNSIRLVIYEGISRAPVPILNEKVFCQLARGLTESGQLSVDGREKALRALRRFAIMCRRMAVSHRQVVATAAVRDARDGADFVATVLRETGLAIQILDGEDEARLTALGVATSTRHCHGVVGDIGGGSLELVSVSENQPSADAVTLPLGTIRIATDSGGKMRTAQKRIPDILSKVGWLKQAKGQPLYVVGGSWRALARIHISQRDYPIKVLHGYHVETDAMETLCRVITGLGPETLSRFEGIATERLDSLPWAAAVLGCVIKRMKPSRIIFSAFGLREGLLFDLLTPEQQSEDPLLVAAANMAERHRRANYLGDELTAWTSPLFMDETASNHRLRRAATLLSDMGWRIHPEYRAEHSFRAIIGAPFVAVGHDERLFLARTLYVRYAGRTKDQYSTMAKSYLNETQNRNAFILVWRCGRV